MVSLYDTTLRDGSQQEGISFSVTDKLSIASKLAELGIHCIEGGWPGANPKDTEFFRRAQDLDLKGSQLVAFGSTRRAQTLAKEDAGLKALLDSGVDTITLVAKASAPQVTHTLGISLEENLAMVSDSIAYLRAQGRRVFVDAEHVFDGFMADSGYTLEVLRAAAKVGAEIIVLCDTNGGRLPEEIVTVIEAVRGELDIPLGIHAHNDAELAVANTLAAVRAGAVQVQGTINGYGERCGNANLCSIIPALKLKMGIDCIPDQRLSLLTPVSRFVSELANRPHDPFLPYVGSSAFTHKGGLHVAAVNKWPASYQHIDPALVGNKPRVLISELSGRSTIIRRARELNIGLDADSPKAREILEQVKQLERQGFQYENAEASFDLMLYRTQDNYRPPFELWDFMVVVEKRRRSPVSLDGEVLAEAIIKVKLGEEVVHTASEGNGPVNALDRALRKALLSYYPELSRVNLQDYKVRILEGSTGTESPVRVLIESSDGYSTWRTVGSSVNIIEASWQALADSIEYFLLRERMAKGLGKTT